MMTSKSIHDANALLLYRVGPVYCCSPTLNVEAVIMPPQLTHPPGSNVAEPGVFKTAQGIVKAVDLRKRFGVDKEDWNEPGRIIVIEIEGGHAGLWVDEIVDVIQFPQKGWADVPVGIPKNVFSRTLLLNNIIQLYADFEKIYSFRETGYLRQHIENINLQKEKEKTFSVVEKIAENNSVEAVDREVKKKDVNEKSVESSVGDKLIKPSVQNSDESSNDLTGTIEFSPENNKNIRVHKKEPERYSGTKYKKETIEHEKREAIDLINKKPDKSFSLNISDQYIKTHNVSGKSEEINTANVNNNVSQKNYGFIFVLFIMMLMAVGYLLFEVLIDTKKEIADRSFIKTIILEEEIKEDSPVPENIDNSVSEVGDYINDVEDIKNIQQENNQFHADIQKDEEGLVIVLTQPEETSDPVSSLEADKKEISDISSAMNKVDLPEKNMISKVGSVKDVKDVKEDIKVKVADSVSKITLETIVHIVVKGDTLWHIAKRYINNPFRYPELARLSHIKNPDLIYPGDKVKIIFNKNNYQE